jgi:hypothetical protein
MSSESNGSTHAEFHFLSERELYDNTIMTVDRHHSSAGEWVVHGDFHWYTMTVVTRPTYSLPQELCLSFDCFWKTETIGSSTMQGPPVEQVALEFGVLLSLLVREPLLPLGVRRLGGKPIRLYDSASQIYRPKRSSPIPDKGVNSAELRAILCGIADADERDSTAFLAAARLYHAALSLCRYEVSIAYFLLVSAIECLSGHYLRDMTCDFADVQKFHKAGEVIEKVYTLIPYSDLTNQLKQTMLNAEHFVWQKFRDFIEQFLPEEIWQEDEIHPYDPTRAAIKKETLRRFLRKVYEARSEFAHTGTPFPAPVEIGISDRVAATAVMEIMAQANSSSFVPAFVWFERLTHLVLREYLYRVIAPEMA